MVTYIYWVVVIGVAIGVLLIAMKTDKVKLAALASIVIFAAGWVAY